MAAETTKPSHPLTIIENIQLEDLERAIYRRDREAASALLLQALRRLKAGGTFIGYQTSGAVMPLLYTRFCAAVVALLADPQFQVSPEGFDLFAAEHAIIDLVFRASAFDTSDHLMAQIGERAPDGSQAQAGGQGLMKFMLTYSLVSSFNLNFADAFGKGPRAVITLWAGMLTALLTISERAQARREELLGLHTLFADVAIPDSAMPALADAYMYSSYGLRRDKHDMKATVHKLFADVLRARGVPVPSEAVLSIRRVNARVEPHFSDKKPTILIPVEWFSSVHAMYRCYAPFVRQLRKRFRVVGIGRGTDVDAGGKAEFDEFIELPPSDFKLLDVVRAVEKVAPDMIWYPSLGMAMWWVALASVRLAPIQFMTLGHPASSRSPAMDYVLCDEGAIGDPTLFTEKIVTYPNGAGRFVMRADGEWPEPNREDHPDVVHVAVPAMLCKLNAPFMQTLREVERRVNEAFEPAPAAIAPGLTPEQVAAFREAWASKLEGKAAPMRFSPERKRRTVQFHFFVNMIGVNLFQAGREIRAYLPTALVYERTEYTQYLRHLARCHVHLSTWPFGGTNSVIDSMLLGTPLVAMWGDEPHERFDGMMMRRARLPEWLIATDPEAYVKAAVSLITEDDARNVVRDHLLGFDVQSEFFGDGPHGDAFLAAVTRVYEQHEQIQQETRDAV